jgi:uncharacterized protein
MLTPIKIQKVELSVAFTACYLASEDRVFVIYLPNQSGKLIQQLVAKAPCERPTSFDFIQSLVVAADLKPLHVVIEDEKEGVFFTKVFLQRLNQELEEVIEVDSRPTEALAFSISFQIPLFITSDLLLRLNNLTAAPQDS